MDENEFWFRGLLCVLMRVGDGDVDGDGDGER